MQSRRHYEQKEAELIAKYGNNSQQQTPPPQSTAQPGQLEQPPVNENFGDWIANEQARAFGYKDKQEMVSDWREKEQLLEKFKDQQTVSEFFMHYPDYPNTEQANAALDTIISGNGWNWTPETMGAAHALAVQNRMYQPLSREEIAVANGYAQPTPRPTPPPMIMGGSPDAQQSTQGPWEMPLDQLRKQALQAGRAGER